jgi:2-polyprenyl-3-methyl-5-hydroxy-6-metoxy-1,4-benzoquinol methylase
MGTRTRRNHGHPVNVFKGLFGKSQVDAPQDVMLSASERVPIDFPDSIERAFPSEFPDVWRATNDVLALSEGADLTGLERRSPGLRGYDWPGYLRCSTARLVRVAQQLRAGNAQGPVLDLGSYFGNASLVCRRLGFEVDALDSYAAYRPSLEEHTALMRERGVRVLDFADIGYDLEQLRDAAYGVVLCLGVIEHVPHTPRPMLQALFRVLKPGGVLLLDTPNIAYLYNRRKLARGESIMAPIASQFDAEVPFEGHHREYSSAEIAWMLQRVGFEQVWTDTFNYSYYALSELSGDDLECHRIMEADPSARELILASARKPHG